MFRQRLRDWWSGEDDGFDPVAVFRRLYAYERVILLSVCALLCVAVMGGMLSSNLGPHVKALITAKEFDTGELTRLLRLIGSVTLITCMSYFVYARWLPFLSKTLMVAVAVLLLHGSLKNSAGIQARDREARTAPYSTKAERIKYLDERIKGLKASWKNLTEHKGDAFPDVVVATNELEARKATATDECHFGKFGRTRGPKCEKAESDRKEKATEVQTLTGAHMGEVQAELPGLERERATYPEKPPAVDAEQNEITAFYASSGLPGIGAFTEKHDAMIEAITMDLMVMAFMWPLLMAVFRIFGTISANRGDAEERVRAMEMTIAANWSADTAAKLEAAAPKEVEKPAYDPFGIYKDKVNHAEVLGIDEPDPAFVEAPRTVEEAASAEYYKAAKAKRPRQPRTPKGEPAPLNESTVVQWFNERCFEAVGRITLSTEAHPDYVQWCKQHNYTAYKVRKFGDILEKQCFVKKQRTNGATKYYDIGIRPAHLRVVSG